MEGYHGYATPQTKVYSAGGGLLGGGGILGTGITPQIFDSVLTPSARVEKYQNESGLGDQETDTKPEDEGPDTTTIIVLVFAGLLVLGGSAFLTYKLSS